MAERTPHSQTKGQRRTFRSVHRKDVQIFDEGYISGYWCKVVGTAGGFLMIELRDGSRIDGWFRDVTRWRRERVIDVSEV